MHKEKVYLVLGANGFVGSYLVDHLARHSTVRVRAFDRYSHGPQFRNAPNVEIIKGDFSDDNDIRSALVGVDYVIHSFSATTPFVSDNNPYVDITSNLLRSVQIFDMCAAEGIKKIGFISSGGAVYGSLAESKVAEESDPPLPVSPYGINKLAIEHYLEYFKRKQGLPYVVYRLTNPYGPRQVTKHNQGVIPLFISKISKGEEITIYGDGSASRDYIYIEDAAGMIVTSFLQDNRFPVYNIGRGEQTSLKQVIEELTRLSGAAVGVAYEDSPKTFLVSTGVNIERFEREFGPIAFTSLHDGLAATMRSLRR